MAYPNDRKYTKDHEWVKLDGDTAICGISDFAQQELGDIVFIELPDAGKSLAQGDTACVVESTKAASDVYAPVSGDVVEGNAALGDSPELVNSDPHEAGWMMKLSGVDAAQVEALMDADAYGEFVAGQG